tara:strand:- start:9521 stop:10255 length:735 start_codon:yes stop_codon:yes gene_type:complete
MSTVKISEYTGNISGSNINIGATGSFGRIICTTISSSTGEFDANTIFIGGTAFSKSNLDDLKDGKPLGTGIKQFKSPTDDSVYIRQSVAGKSWHYASDVALMKVQTSSFELGAGNVPTTLEGSAIAITGSTEVTGSLRVVSNNQQIEFDAGSGGFNVNNLLDLLANFSSSGVEGGVEEGDINLDGQVNVNDLLLGLSGYGNPNTIANNILIPHNINHQYIGPTITILSPVSMSISTGSFVSITL